MLSATSRTTLRTWGWALALACAAAPAAADQAKDKDKASKAAPPAKAEPLPPPGTVYTLGQCIGIAHEQSPVLKAARAGVISSEASYRGIDKASRIVHSIFAPDLEYRKQQATNGMIASQAELMQAEYDVTFDVIRTYYSAVYALEQLKTVSDLVAEFDVQVVRIRNAVKEGVRGVTLDLQNQVEIYRGQAAARQVDARSGYERALRALAHEMGVGPECRFDVADRTLPDRTSSCPTRGSSTRSCSPSWPPSSRWDSSSPRTSSPAPSACSPTRWNRPSTCWRP